MQVEIKNDPKRVCPNTQCSTVCQSTTFRFVCLSAGRLCTADYTPGLLGTWTFRALDY